MLISEISKDHEKKLEETKAFYENQINEQANTEKKLK